jgi:hypothetical protein
MKARAATRSLAGRSVTLACLTVLHLGCAGPAREPPALSTDAAAQSEAVADSWRAPAGIQACEAWDQIIESLDTKQRANLRDHGVARARGDSQEFIVFDPSFEPDCERRIRIARWVSRVIDGGEPDPEEERFLRENSREVGAVLLRVWPILNNEKCVLADGAFWYETWSLLACPDLASRDVAPLVDDALARQGLHGTLAWLLFERADMGLDPAVRRELRGAERRGDVQALIFALAYLARSGEPNAIAALRRLGGRRDLSTFERGLVRDLVAKAARGEAIVYADIEDLEYQ